MELALLALFRRNIEPASGAYAHRPGLLKAVYLAPTRALVQVWVPLRIKAGGCNCGMYRVVAV